MIVPAILTDKKENFGKMLTICAEFTNFVQVDIMDGKFVPSKSISLDELAEFNSPVHSEAHLMVKEPIEWIAPFCRFGAKRIIFHYEFGGNHYDVIRAIKKAGLEAGIAVNPSTAIGDFEFLMNKIDYILFMAVNPGFYGAPFIPAVLEKIKQFKRKYPSKLTAIDGGVKPDNIAKVMTTGVDYICVGSAILKEANPKQAYLKFSGVLE